MVARSLALAAGLLTLSACASTPPPPPPISPAPRPAPPPPAATPDASDDEISASLLRGSGPPPPPPPPPSVMPPIQRISGSPMIIPSDHVKRAITARGETQLMIPVKLCLDGTGAVTSVKVMKSSGYAAYDADIVNAIYTWRYRPFLVNGNPTPVCTAIQFLYLQPPAPPTP